MGSGFTDLHCHLLWGIDDGAKTEDDSLAMARAMVSMGFSDVACSPHARPEYPSMDPALCAERLEQTQAALDREKIPLRLHSNAENVLDPELVFRVEKERRLIGNGPYILAEAPYFTPLPQLGEIIFRLRVKGITPLIAHPERCKEFQRRGRAEEAVRAGARLQLDIGALIGRYGRRPRKLARSFLEEGLYSVAATDLHTPTNDAKWVADSIEELRRLAGDDAVERLLGTNPGKILRGEQVPEPI